MTAASPVDRAARRGAAATLVALAVVAAARAETPAALTDCHVAGLRNGVLCGTLQRPLDPAHPERAQVSIR